MRSITICSVIFVFTSSLCAADAPLVRQYLESGQLAKGEQVLRTALDVTPQDDQIRFGLGVLQVFRGVERLGQSLYEYGCKSENSFAPIFRFPVPQNPDPTPVTYSAIRRVLEVFQSDLAAAEATLAGVTDRDVKLRLQLAAIHLDLDGDGQATDLLEDILKKMVRQNLRFPVDNPDFNVCFDRGDVAWLRAYCHLLIAIVDAQLAFDLEPQFDQAASHLFEIPKQHVLTDAEQEWRKNNANSGVICEPARLGKFRKHVMAVCDLNHETWMYIRIENDDDQEWLPNSKQKGVIGLPVSDEMIDAWLGMVDEVHGLCDGKRVVPNWVLQFLSSKVPPKAQFDMKVFFEDPPELIDVDRMQKEGFKPKYLVYNGTSLDVSKFIRVSQVFQNTLGVGYSVWFN
jgi:hypothetical protein